MTYVVTCQELNDGLPVGAPKISVNGNQPRRVLEQSFQVTEVLNEATRACIGLLGQCI